jgi:hypothetical protein
MRPLSFLKNMPRNTASSVLVRTTGVKKLWCTVMLSINMNGRKLLPYVILKRKTMPKGKFPSEMHIRVPEIRQMVSELMEDGSMVCGEDI